MMLVPWVGPGLRTGRAWRTHVEPPARRSGATQSSGIALNVVHDNGTVDPGAACPVLTGVGDPATI